MFPPPLLLALRFGHLDAFDAIGRLPTCSTPMMMMTLVMMMKMKMMVSKEATSKRSTTSVTSGNDGGRGCW